MRLEVTPNQQGRERSDRLKKFRILSLLQSRVCPRLHVLEVLEEREKSLKEGKS
jgi:hypothetical protein